RARRGLDAARVLAESAPDSCVVLAYDAARQACVAVLAQQGLRPTTAGGHYAVEEAIRAQFGPVLRSFGGLRRRRNELEYPLYPTEQADAAEAAETLSTAAEVIDAAAKLLPNLGFF
ncbi:MAG: HEPN domain-containing protein, partial [Steroidobacteraceae bacterium]